MIILSLRSSGYGTDDDVAEIDINGGG